MSIVLITSHHESIYDAIATPKDHLLEGRETSSGHFYKKVREERKDPKKFQKYGTFGLPNVTRPDPKNFLKKGTLKPPMRPPEIMDPDYGNHKCSLDKKLNSTPTRDEILQEQDAKLSKWKPKNAIRKNALDAINMKPKIPSRTVMIDNKGTTKPLKPSLEPTFLPSNQYGRLPKYLASLAKEKEKNRLKLVQITDSFQPICRYLVRDKRKALLSGLKENWAEMQRQYSLLPILTDTIPKKNRKSKLEAELKQLESDVVLIERHPYIYIYPDDDLDKKN